MKPLALNLSQMQKIAGDDKSSTFLHPNGHKMMIAHSGVSSLQRKQLEKMPIQKLADGGEAGSGEDIPYDKLIPQEQADNAPYTMGQPAPAPQQDLSAPNKVPVDSLASNDVSVPSPEAAPAPTKAASPSYLEQERSAIMKGAEAEGRAGSETANAIASTRMKMDPENLPSIDDIRQKYEDRRVELEKALTDNKIDPRRWYNNQDTGQKLTHALGQLLSGMGSATTGGANLAQQNISNAIDQDIDSQKNEQSKTMNLWKMNRENMQSDMEANAATRTQMLTDLKLQTEQIMNASQDPLAKARAAQALTGINQQIDISNHYLGSMSGQGSDTEDVFKNRLGYMQQMNPEYFKDMQSKYIPGVGVASVPVNEKDREAMTSYGVLKNAIQSAISFQKNEAGALGTFPGSAANSVAESKRQAIVLELNKLHGLNRLNDNEYNSYMQSVGSPGAFRATRSLEKFNELAKQVERTQRATMGSLGITPFKKPDQNQVAMAWAKANPRDPRALAIMQRLNGQPQQALVGNQ